MSKTEAESIAELAVPHPSIPRVLEIERGDSAHAAILTTGPGIVVHDLKPLLDKYLERPERRQGGAALADLASFIEHAKRFASEHSAIFCDRIAKDPKLVSVLDYHEKGAAGAPAWGRHRGVYAFPLSKEWLAWTAKNGTQMSQAEFAQFIEDRITDVTDPEKAKTSQGLAELLELLGTTFASPSKLLELSKGLSVRENARVKSAVNLATGEKSISYENQLSAEDGGPIKVPGAFAIAIPVFRRGAHYLIAARLRFRTVNGGITWWYDLHNIERRFDDAIDEAAASAAKETGLPLYMGTPEA